MIRALLARVAGQERALANARAASTELSRQRVEREEVELFLVRARRACDPHRMTAHLRRARGLPPG